MTATLFDLARPSAPAAGRAQPAPPGVVHFDAPVAPAAQFDRLVDALFNRDRAAAFDWCNLLADHAAAGRIAWRDFGDDRLLDLLVALADALGDWDNDEAPSPIRERRRP